MTHVMKLKQKFRQMLFGIAISICALIVSVTLAELLIQYTPLADRFGWNKTPPFEKRLATALSGQFERPIIMGLGDSFTEFRDSEGKNFLRIAQSELKRSGRFVSLVNLAQAGTGLKSYKSVLLTEAPVIKPDIVIIGLYLGNDILDYEREIKATSLPGNRPNSVSPQTNKIKNNWIDRVKRFSILLNLVFRIAKQYIPLLRSGFYERNISVLSAEEHKDRQFIVEREAQLDPHLLDLARSDSINSWDEPVQKRPSRIISQKIERS